MADIRSLQQRLIDKVEFEPNSGCWLWTGATTHFGYGRIGIDGHGGSAVAHRVSWELSNGPIPKGLHVCHRCDTPACVNPDHLFLGTQRENIRDCRAKGRTCIGGKRSTAKLSEAVIPEIRARLRRGESQYSIAKDFGVSRGAILQVNRGRSWAHV